MTAWLRGAVRSLLPSGVTRRLRRLLVRPRVGTVDLGDLGGAEPVSRNWGTERGTPVDRVLMDEFLLAHADGVRGRVLEWGNRHYTVRLGGNRVTQSDIFDIDGGNRLATVVGDLCRPDGLPRDAFDAILCLQTLQFVADLPAAVRGLHRMLRPGGLLVVTVPGIAPVRVVPGNPWPDFWRLTPTSLEWLLHDVFAPAPLRVASYGNVLTATAFLQGLAAEELPADDLARHDSGYPVIVGGVVRKAAAPG